MNKETRELIENQIHKLNMIDGTLDIARDCFAHFQNHKTSETELDQYSAHGQNSVQVSRATLKKVVEALQKTIDSN
jgi:hypothetical protein